MASYETVLTVPRPVATTFAFVSDFRNAARWDPRTYAAEKATEGPVGLGTRFVLTGGLLPQRVIERLRIPSTLAGMSLPYDVVVFDPPHQLVLEGATRLVTYRDHLEFTAAAESTRLRYAATLELRGPAAIASPLLQRLFQRIGDDATRDLPSVVAAG